MGTTWGYGPVEFTVDADEDTIVVLDVPYRGTIKAINFQEVGGGSGAGVIEIYDSNGIVGVFTPGSSDNSNESASVPSSFDPIMHSVTGPLTVAAGAHKAAFDLPYLNRDGSPTNGQRRLYMRVNVDNAGPYALSMTIDPAALTS